jgi:Chaperone of endosialidase
MSTIINGTDNSSSTPAITGSTGGTGTGVFYPANNQVALATNGTTAITVDASQNVGIGTASPSNLLTLFKNSGAYSLDLNGAGYGTLGRFGIVNVGTDNTTYIGSISNNPFAFYTVGTERMRIDSSGNLLVGTTTPVANTKFTVLAGNGLSALSATNTSGTALYYAAAFYNNGTSYSYCGGITVSGSTTTYATSSDYRLKDNIAPMTGALDIVSKLKPVTYKWKSDGSDSQGFIAHELQAVVPECVVGEKDAVDAEGKPVYQGIDTSFLVATLTAAIQELNAKVAELEAKVK